MQIAAMTKYSTASAIGNHSYCCEDHSISRRIKKTPQKRARPFVLKVVPAFLAQPLPS